MEILDLLPEDMYFIVAHILAEDGHLLYFRLNRGITGNVILSKSWFQKRFDLARHLICGDKFQCALIICRFCGTSPQNLTFYCS